MNPDRWQQIDDLFHAALAQPPGQRAVFLEEVCGRDTELRREIESLLSCEPAAENFLEVSSGNRAPTDVPERIGSYRLLERLGEGGMGVVHLAEDERLGRRVALKFLRNDASDAHARARLIREARVAAAVTHPLICQVFELGEWEGRPFIAMELLDGESLATLLKQGPLAAAEALRIAISVVDALDVLHRQGIIHRDLKPSNIFVTGAGVKILDFGLARSMTSTGSAVSLVTVAGVIAGTPQYAAPEQLLGAAVDARADLFAAGVVLFEMLAGRPPFGGDTIAATIHSTLYDAPPVLTGSAAIAAVDRVLHRALAKRAEDRYQSAEALAADLRPLASIARSEDVAAARTMLRLAVLPFRMLTPDSETEYLGLSLAEAVASSLSGRESLVVRSSLKSARYVGMPLDLRALATDLAVDAVLSGSILRRDNRLRITAELVSVPAGDVWWTESSQVPIGDVMDFYEHLTARVLASLPLLPKDQAREQGSRPSSTKAFDLYLRGMQLRMEASGWRQARALFERCLEIDPAFAPAWAELGRLDRVLGKYEDPSLLAHAESAFTRALALDPDCAVALYYSAQLDVDLGRVDQALERLVARARQGRAEPQVYAGLVHACRYAGLLDASVAADNLARRLDPAVVTSVLHTYYMRGDYARALEAAHRSSDPFEARVLAAIGRDADAIAAARREEERFAQYPVLGSFSTAIRAAIEGRRDEAVAALDALAASPFRDGEGLFYRGEICARLGLVDEAFSHLDRSADSGFFCAQALERSTWLEWVRPDRRWPALMDRVTKRQNELAEQFARAGGRALLG